MDLLPLAKMKAPKSRIPVAITSKKISKLHKTEKNLFDNKPLSDLQTLNANKNVKSHVLQKSTGKKCSPIRKIETNQRDKSDSKLKKSIQPSSKTNVKFDDSKKENKIKKDFVKYNFSKREAFSKLNVKPSLNKKELVSLTKNKMRCIKAVEYEKEKSLSLKTGVSNNDEVLKLCTPKFACIKEKRISPQQDSFSAQKDIKFEANEVYRNMILSNRELSPSICRLMPGIRFSSLQTQRPSAYQKFEMSIDPVKETLKALENTSLSVKKIKKLPVKDNKMQSPYKDRASFYTPCADPKQEVMKSLEECRLKKSQTSVPSPKKVTFSHNTEGIDIKFEEDDFYRNMILSNRELSPNVCRLMPGFRYSSFQDRPSFYTPCADPKQEVMKSLEEYRLKKLQKTVPSRSKKVTFSLNVEECTPRNFGDNESLALKNSEHRLVQISEKSEENTPNSPQNEKEMSLKDESNILLSNMDKIDPNEYMIPNECQDTKTISETDNVQRDSHIDMKKCEHLTSGTLITKLCHTSLTPEKLSSQYRKHSPQNLNNGCWISTFICDSKVVSKTSTSVQNTVNIQALEQKCVNNFKNSKVYTPRPVSCFSKSKLNDSYSPEFLVNVKSRGMPELAPICTPLVLKSIAKRNMFSPEDDLSPVRLKLDFTDVEKDTPKREIPKNQPLVTFENIITIQKRLDDLADQECCLLLLNEGIPIICGRYLTNPVALTLSEGDDMHFIPIQL